MRLFENAHRTGNERELDKQNAILKAAQSLFELGGTEQQKALALKAIRMAEGRRNTARNRVEQDRANERSRRHA